METGIWKIDGDYVIAENLDQAIEYWRRIRWAEWADADSPFMNDTAFVRKVLQRLEDGEGINWTSPHSIELVTGLPITADRAMDHFTSARAGLQRYVDEFRGEG